MKITKELLDELVEKAKESPRLRISYDLRESANDNSQRALNVLEPGTEVPIHRHPKSTETSALLRGSMQINIYNNRGDLVESYIVSATSDTPFYIIPAMTWHNCDVLESGTISFEAKEGAYEPTAPEDLMYK